MKCQKYIFEKLKLISIKSYVRRVSSLFIIFTDYYLSDDICSLISKHRIIFYFDFRIYFIFQLKKTRIRMSMSLRIKTVSLLNKVFKMCYLLMKRV